MRTMDRVAASIEKMSTDAFRDHEATITRLDDQTQILVWAAPKKSMYAAEYIIRRNVLIVLGDMGNAIYMWSAPITFEGLASYSLDYFSGKIQASPSGRYGEEWFPEKAADRLAEWVQEPLDSPFDESPATEHERRREVVYGSGGYRFDNAESASGTQEDWSRWLEHHGEEAFGMDWWEWGSIGVGINSQTRYHWHGIRAAMKWLKENS